LPLPNFIVNVFAITKFKYNDLNPQPDPLFLSQGRPDSALAAHSALLITFREAIAAAEIQDYHRAFYALAADMMSTGKLAADKVNEFLRAGSMEESYRQLCTVVS